MLDGGWDVQEKEKGKEKEKEGEGCERERKAAWDCNWGILGTLWNLRQSKMVEGERVNKVWVKSSACLCVSVLV
jgi:hypothetical protein